MLCTLADARRIIDAAYPGMRFKIKKSYSIGVRAVCDHRPILAWRRLDGGKDSAVMIGRMDPSSGNIDWKYSP